MHPLINFYDSIGREIGRRLMEDETQQVEEIARPSWITRLLSKFTFRPRTLRERLLNQREELALDTAECQ
jgi:hypothetical protein